MINNFLKKLAIKRLSNDEEFISSLVNQSSYFALKNSLSNRTDLLNKILVSNREKIIEITEEFPQIAYKDHIEKIIELLEQLNSDQGVIVDVGAAYGEVSQKILSKFPNYQFLLFEPILKSYTQLVEKFQKNHNVHIFNNAVGETKDKLVMNIALSDNSSSLLDFSDESDMNNFFTERVKLTDKQEVDVTTLDNELNDYSKISLIKIDVQGFEVPVLKGATETLKKTKYVLCEMMNHDVYLNSPQYYDIDSYLRKSGFKLKILTPGLIRENKLWEFDAIYENSNFE